MAYLHDAPPTAPILPSIRSTAPAAAQQRRIIRAADPFDELILPPADGKVLRPGDVDYETLLPFNRRTLVRPQAVAQCRTANGVSLAIQWARDHEVELCSHSGGHSYEGFSSCAGLMIDVRSMNAVVIDATAQTARIGAGSLLGDVAEKLFVQKLGLPAGSCKPVGIAGLTLGGGHGFSSRKFGLTADSLLSAQVVDATGAVLTASATES